MTQLQRAQDWIVKGYFLKWHYNKINKASMTPAWDPKLGFALPSYMMMMYDDIWKSFGSHLGVIWDPFGSHVGSIWRHLAGWRLKRHLEARSQITSLPLQRNAKVPLKFQFHEGFLRVPSIMTAYLQQHLLPAGVDVSSYSSRALYQDRENSISWS